MIFLRSRQQQEGIATLVLALLLVLNSCTNDPHVHMQKGMAYMADGKYPEAILEFKSVVQIDPRDASAYYHLGLAYLKKGQSEEFSDALRAFEQSVQLDVNNLEARLKLGELYLLTKDFDATREQAATVLQSAPDRVQAYVLLSHAYRGKAAWGPAIQALQAALKLDHGLLSLHLQLADLYQHANEFGPAEQTYRHAL